MVTERSTTNIGSQNSQRDPQRTAATAAALMIGLALVTLMATFAAGIIKPFEDAVDQIFIADYAITAQNNFDPLPPSVAAAAATAPGGRGRSGVRGGEGRVFGSTVQVTGGRQAGWTGTGGRLDEGLAGRVRRARRDRRVRRRRGTPRTTIWIWLTRLRAGAERQDGAT